MRRRIAFIDYFPTHYRRSLYEELGRRMEVDFYFFADERERYWNRKIPLLAGGDFRRVEIQRMRIAGQALMPGITLALGPKRYDAVVKSLNGKLMLPLTYLTSRARGVPFVLWTGMWRHPETLVHRATKPIVEHLYRQVGAIVVYGEHVKRALLEVPDLDAGKIFVAGQAVDASRFTSVHPRRDDEVAEILFVGQFEERKGLTYLLDAFAALSDLPARLRLIGNGSLEGQIRSRIADDPKVDLVGYVPQESLPDELARARCLVLPSITTAFGREPWGLVVNEAMHAGLPVVATDVVGAAAGGLVRPGENGYVVPERDPRALAGALRELVTDPVQAAALGERARADVHRFDYPGMVDAFQAAVEHSIAAHRAARRHEAVPAVRRRSRSGVAKERRRRIIRRRRALDRGSSRLAGRTAALALIAGRDLARSRGKPFVPPRYEVPSDSLEAAIDWLCLTHDVTGRRGSSKGFSLLFGWYPPFPETTGYVIGTLLAYSRLTADDGYAARAREMGDWELEVQSPDGGIIEGLLDGAQRRSEVFNTGMVIQGWLDLHESLSDDAYIRAAERAGRFILRTQDGDGAWRGEHSYRGLPHAYFSCVSWVLLRLGRALGDPDFESAARRNLDWVLGMQRGNGWIDACIFKPGTLPNTHAIAYTLRGLLESSVLLEDDRYLDAVQRSSGVLMRKLEGLGPLLPATFDEGWNPSSSYVCLTGMVQLGAVWLRLFQLTGDARFLNAGLRAIDATAAHQERVDWRPVRGALPGSFPIYGRYAPLQCPNWATKFLADALMLRAECLRASAWIRARVRSGRRHTRLGWGAGGPLTLDVSPWRAPSDS